MASSTTAGVLRSDLESKEKEETSRGAETSSGAVRSSGVDTSKTIFCERSSSAGGREAE